jgi:hypothetical protein
MRKSSGSFLVWIHATFAIIAAPFKHWAGVNRRGFSPQRMCPFCGLITPRSKSLCLECGKHL